MNAYAEASRGGWIHRSEYPNSPGHKARDTAKAAAEGIAPKARPLRERVLAEIWRQPSTPEEVAERLGVPVMNVRPRCSELVALGLIEDSGQRREATGGRRAIVWRSEDAR